MPEKIFTQNGEEMPKIRFNGFTEEWEPHKLGDLSEITDTKHATAPVVDFETPYRMIRTSEVDTTKKEEQTKIGNFYRHLDNTIALHRRK